MSKEQKYTGHPPSPQDKEPPKPIPGYPKPTGSIEPKKKEKSNERQKDSN